MRPFPWAFATLVVTASVAAAGADKRTQAVQLAEDSEKAYKAGHFEQAVELLRKAHELYPEPTLLYNLGRALEGMGDARNAVAAYERYLRDAKQIDDRGAIERRVATLKAQIAREPKPKSPGNDTQPPQPDQHPPQPDQHPPQPSGGETIPPPTPPGHDDPLPPRAVPSGGADRGDTGESDSLSFLPWITMGTGSAIVLTGALYGWRASTNHNAAFDEPSQQRALALQNAATHDASIANVMFAVGGAIVIGGAAWEFLAWRQRDRPPAQTLRVKVAPGGLAVEWSLR
jgi:tetratricopeptide (TPR) repeat protein